MDRQGDVLPLFEHNVSTSTLMERNHERDLRHSILLFGSHQNATLAECKQIRHIIRRLIKYYIFILYL
jgi:hypothetical protein